MQAASTALCADAQAKTRKAQEIFGTDIERCGHDLDMFPHGGTLRLMGTLSPTKMRICMLEYNMYHIYIHVCVYIYIYVVYYLRLKHI